MQLTSTITFRGVERTTALETDILKHLRKLETYYRLAVGSAVSFVEEQGEKGPQASTVKLLHPRRVHRSSHTAPTARVVR